MEPESLLLIGRVFRPHGVKGEVKVIPETDDPERFTALKTIFVGASPEAVSPWSIEGVRFQQTRHGITVVLKLQGVESRDDAEALRPAGVYARRDDLPPLAEDEFFYSDLINLEVVDEAGAVLGHVADVLELPAHEVLVVRQPDGREAMVPAVPAFLLEIDFEAQRIVIRPIEGLFA